MSKPVIVVSPREKFSCAEQSLRSLYAQTKIDFRLVYIEAGGQEKHRDTLRTLQKEFGFELVILEKFLYPNAARNLGLSRARRYAPDWVVFVDNDVVFACGWLEELLRVGEQEDAAAVSPLVCQDAGEFREVHAAGGLCRVEKGRLVEEITAQGELTSEISPEVVRTELFEFHCVLVRMYPELQCDPNLLNTREHVDLSLEIRARGGRVYLASRSQVAYLPTELNSLTDLILYELRWSNLHKQTSLDYFAKKWGVDLASTNRRNINAPRRQKVLQSLEPLLGPYVPDWSAA